MGIDVTGSESLILYTLQADALQAVKTQVPFAELPLWRITSLQFLYVPMTMAILKSLSCSPSIKGRTRESWFKAYVNPNLKYRNYRGRQQD